MAEYISPAPNPSPAVRGEGNVRDIIASAIAEQRVRKPDRPALIGVAGAQGSGKTTACRLVAKDNSAVAHFSLDDVYWSKAERADLGQLIHHLFATRGPPGTHDIDLAHATILALKMATPDQETKLPSFDKLRDEPVEKADLPIFRGRPEAILFDGWCLGALPPAPSKAINAVEAIDSDSKWRASQAVFLDEEYALFFRSFDCIIYLEPPNWEIVRRWRGQQEEDLLGRPMTEEESAKLDRFLMHYERVTRSMMAGGHMADIVVRLNEDRSIREVVR